MNRWLRYGADRSIFDALLNTGLILTDSLLVISRHELAAEGFPAVLIFKFLLSLLCLVLVKGARISDQQVCLPVIQDQVVPWLVVTQRWRSGGASSLSHVFNTLSGDASKGVASRAGLVRETLLLSLIVCSLATSPFVGILVVDLRIGSSHWPPLLHHLINVFEALFDLLLLTGEVIPDVRVLPHLFLKRCLIIISHEHGPLVLV